MLSDDITTVVEEILRAPLAVAKGGIGFVGADLPVDLFVASGRSFGHLPWRAEGTTAWADRWLESRLSRLDAQHSRGLARRAL